jgi:hypothetical protein
VSTHVASSVLSEKDCLTDVTDIPHNETRTMVTFWPDGFEKGVFQFKESDKRWSILMLN